MNTRAFTLVESMVAVTILTLAVAGPLFTAGRAIVAAQTARDQLTASYLAQEGVEYVRALRDDAYLEKYPENTDDAWDNFLDGPIKNCRAPKICTLDRRQSEGDGQRLRPCGNEVCTETFSLLEDGTVFKRTVQVIDVPPDGDVDVRVVSSVSWSFHGISRSVSTATHLTPWQ